MNRFNFGAQAKQAASLVGGLLTAGKGLQKVARGLTPKEQFWEDVKQERAAEKDAAATQKRAQKQHEATQKRLQKDRARELKLRSEAQQSANEYKAKSSQPTLDTNGVLDLLNNQETTTDNTETAAVAEVETIDIKEVE